MTDRLFETLGAVHDEDSFSAFLTALLADWNEKREHESANSNASFRPGANGWENGTIGAYLEAATRWAVSSRNGLPLAGYEPPANPWRRCADILYAGKIYE